MKIIIGFSLRTKMSCSFWSPLEKEKGKMIHLHVKQVGLGSLFQSCLIVILKHETPNWNKSMSSIVYNTTP